MTLDKIRNRSVVKEPQFEQGPYGNFIIYLASIADDIVPWGGGQQNFRVRDMQLRQFWIQENALASALYTIIIRNASFSWTIKGNQPRTVKIVQDMLHNANLGKGWMDFVQKWLLDWLTQDNGAFFEVIRQTDSPDSPAIGINHLDAGACRRTGVPDWPVIYTDRFGGEHKMKWYQIVSIADFPSPIETCNGVGICAVSRVLRQAQLMRDMSVRAREKASGYDPKTLYIVSGVTNQMIQDALKTDETNQIEHGYIRYRKPVIMSNVDPSRTVDAKSLDLAPTPSDDNYDNRMQWYITLLAMALGVDYQDLAPLPSKGIGGSMQSQILHEKAKGKGPELFMKTIEHAFNFHGVIPANVTFEYEEKDPIEARENADLLKIYSEISNNFALNGALSSQAIRNLLLDAHQISQEIFDVESQGAEDVTGETTAQSDSQNLEEPGEQSANEGEVKSAKFSRFARNERIRWEREMEADVAKALKKLYRDIANKILPEKAIKVTTKKPTDLFESDEFWDEFRDDLTKAMTPNVRNVFIGAAAYNAGLGLGVDMEAMNMSVFDFTRNYMTKWLSELDTATREGLRKALLAWQEGGLGEAGLPDLIRSIEPLFGQPRANRIAATEVSRIFDLGNLESHRSAGIEYEQWQTVNDNLVRDEHKELEGKVFRIDEGPRPSDYYNCRCARVPIATDEAERILGIS